MKTVIQRVDFARVIVNSKVFSSISQGLLVYLGIEKGDHEVDADTLVDKILNLRIFEDSQGKMNLSLLDMGGELMVVSQFTLLADCRKGRRPSFIAAEDPARANALYDFFIKRAGLSVRTASGQFQAMMKIESINNGPVTIIMEGFSERKNSNE